MTTFTDNKPKTVTRSPVTNHLSEIMQTNLTQFAMARYDSTKDKIIQCHQFVKCRDFMIDVFVGVEEHKDMGIYGFAYRKDMPRPDPDNISLLLKLTCGTSLSNLQKNFEILTDIDKSLGWTESYAELVEYPDKDTVVVWVMGDKRWQRCAVAFSLYTYILKCLTYPLKDSSKWKEEIKEMKGSVEARYMNIPHIQFLIANMNEIITKYSNFSGWRNQATTYIEKIHDQSGFVTAARIIQEGNADHVLSHFKQETV